jgi:hypothetical protein
VRRAIAAGLAILLFDSGVCLKISSPAGVGVNLDEMVTYSPSLVHCNRVRDSGSWSAILGATGATFGADGWPTGWTGGAMQLSMNTELNRVDAPGGTASSAPAHYPTGTYHITWTGTAVAVTDFNVFNDASGLTPVSAGVATFTIATATHAGFVLRLLNPAKIPTAVSITADNMTCDGNFAHTHIASLQGMGLRFMQRMRANNSPGTTWPTRPIPTIYSYTASVQSSGQPMEDMVDECNTADADWCWFNLPDSADNTYITNFATYVCANLEVGIEAYFEMGNEIWNTASVFADAHNRYETAGAALPIPHWFHYQMKRTAEMLTLVQAAGCTDNQSVIVMGLQNAASPLTGVSVSSATPDWLAYAPAGTPMSTVLAGEGAAMAPYANLGSNSSGTLFTLNALNPLYDGITNASCNSSGFGPAGPPNGQVACCTGPATGTCNGTNIRSWIPTQWQDSYRMNIAPPMLLTKAHCDRLIAAGINCLVYEWGIHSTMSGGGAENDNTLVASHWAAQDDMGMYDVTRLQLAALKDIGVSQAAYFMHCSRANKFNYFAACEWYDTYATSPKWMALHQAATQ